MIVGLLLDAVKGIRHYMNTEAHMNTIVSTMRLEVGDEVACSFFPNGTVDRVGRVDVVTELERGLYVLDITYVSRGDHMRGAGMHTTSYADELWQVLDRNTAKL